LENRTHKTGLFLQSFEPGLRFTVEDELGGVTEVAPGQFQFTDSQATNAPCRFYRLRSL
jgi:hypothetical protein